MNRDEPDPTYAVARLLSEPTRRALYEHVAGQADPVDRDAAARAIGIGRPLAAFHLDRLVGAGLLEVEYHRRSGRSGPGAGRPAKFYRRAAGPGVEISIPPRRYAELAGVFADALERARDDDVDMARVEAGRAFGRTIATRARELAAGEDRPVSRDTLVRALADQGFQPESDEGGIRLRNCPFDALVADHRETTCTTNLAVLEVVPPSYRRAGLAARPDAVPGYCCVTFVRA
jgi:predicted ArsR family transcriptional regulator